MSVIVSARTVPITATPEGYHLENPDYGINHWKRESKWLSEKR